MYINNLCCIVEPTTFIFSWWASDCCLKWCKQFDSNVITQLWWSDDEDDGDVSIVHDQHSELDFLLQIQWENCISTLCRQVFELTPQPSKHHFIDLRFNRTIYPANNIAYSKQVNYPLIVSNQFITMHKNNNCEMSCAI